ncbi:MAG: hypothetical protein ACI4J0_12425 [Huintestinicola sp.]|uniref:hypothetical protein n=1 Tax=Huintestinicola sp. TaxID=2981661 RepID=UPI003F078B2B
MNFFNKNGPEVVYMQEYPAFRQSNGFKIEPRLRKYIMNGEPCEFDAVLKDALESHTNEGLVKVIFMILGYIAAVIYVCNTIMEKGLRCPIWLYLIGFALPLLLIISFENRNKVNRLALKAAKNGDIQCFRYKLCRILQCHTDCTEDDYYADLGDFCVNVSSAYPMSAYICGAVITIDGEEYFYLLV